MEEEIIIIEENDEEEVVIIEDDIEYIAPITQEKTVTPTKEQQIVVPDEGYTGLSKITIEEVTSDIDTNIQPNNIKLGVSILGVEGNVELDKPDQSKEATPTKEKQVITPDTGYELSQVTINPIPDEYIVPTGTLDITTNGEYDVKNYERANVEFTPNLQSKFVIPTKEFQAITADEGYDGLSNVDIVPIPEEYIIPSGEIIIYEGGEYYVRDFERAIVRTVTPSGTLNITENGTHNVYEYEFVDVNAKYKPRYISFYYYQGTELEEELANLDTSTMTSFNYMFGSCTYLTSIPLIDTSSGKTFDNMFNNCQRLSSVPLIDTSKGITFHNMFYACTQLTTIPLLDVSSAIYLNRMFYNCSGLITIPLLNTSNVEDVTYLFYGCTKLTSIPLIDTSSVTNFYGMFYNCSILPTIPQLDTSSGTEFSSMFYSCPKLTSIPLINTSSGKTFTSMFQYCRALTSIPQLDTSSGTTFTSTFNGCSALKDIPLLDFGKATRIDNIFSSCTALENLGGFLNFGQACLTTTSANNSYFKLDLSKAVNLTHDSLMNVINNLYDIASKGCKTQALVLGATNLAKLSSDEIAIATNKGFSVS